MSHSPLISKIRCYNANQKKSRVCVRNHLIYIGTREGVDLTPLEQSLERFNEESLPEESSNEQYLKYIAERPNSNGLFGNIIISDPITFGNQLADYSRSGKNIYRAIVSLSEQDALELGFDQKENWAFYLHKVMPDIGREFNIPIDKLKWTAAVHMKKEHPHVHYMFWRSDEKVSSSFIHPSVQNRCREILSKEMFQEERTQSVLNKTLSRDLVLDIGKEVLNNELEYILNGTLGKIPENIKEKDIKEVATSLLKFIPSLPTHGRLAYQLLSPSVKKELDHVVEKILELPPIREEYNNYKGEIKKLSTAYSPTQQKNATTLLRAEYDLKKRLSNQILKTCKNLIHAELNIQNKLLSSYQKNQPTFKDELFFSEKIIDRNIDNTINSYETQEPFADINYWSKTYKEATKNLYSENPDYEKVIFLLKKEATKDNPLALHDLGKIYEKGLGGLENSELSFEYYKSSLQIFNKISNTNSNLKTYANYRIGKMHQYGSGTEINYTKAIDFYKMAADENNKYAQYSLGNMYLYGTGVDITEENKLHYHSLSLKLFEKSAEQGNPYADFSYANLAKSEFSSIGEEIINTSYSSALNGFEALYCENQSDDLAYKIGSMYVKGLGCEISIPKAIEYFKDAARFKNHFAYYSLGKIYSDANSEFYDLEKGVAFLKLSHDAGNEFSTLHLANLYSNDALSLFDLKKAINYLNSEKLAQNDFAQYKLGKIYSNVESDLFNLPKAIEHFKTSALKGNEHAQYALGKIYSDSEKPFYNIPESIYWFSKSAEQNNSYAQYSLGKIYSDPGNPFYNINTAIDLLLKSAEHNNDFAQLALANIYLWGRPGLKKDETLGKYYLNLSIQNNNPYANDSLKMYENYKASFIMGSAQRMLLNLFSAIAVDRRKNIAEHEFKNQTKAQLKIDAKRHGKSQQSSDDEKER